MATLSCTLPCSYHYALVVILCMTWSCPLAIADQMKERHFPSAPIQRLFSDPCFGFTGSKDELGQLYSALGTWNWKAEMRVNNHKSWTDRSWHGHYRPCASWKPASGWWHQLMHKGKQRYHEFVDGKTHEALERQAEGVTTWGPDGFLTLVRVPIYT